MKGVHLGRHRSIDREAVLDAAERVVVREGAAKLTLDAVAVEAGISKASVLYDYKTKRELVRKLVERKVAGEEALVQKSIEASGDEPDKYILSRLAVLARNISEADHSVGLNLCVALTQDVSLREPVQKAFQTSIDEIARSSRHPRGALLALLAMQGLVLLERFDWHSFGPSERAGIIQDISWLIDQSLPLGA